MAIEVRQLVIKSTVLQSGHPEQRIGFSSTEHGIDPELLKQEIVSDCRALLLEMFREQKER
ncbi:hypothetical protein MNBD_NITROSPIRAE01-2065 [hydrothermal vent metagenome]|uniref:Uncharacterized protein n=1 Tax=hydrothermal vent metagenome TaxID=652676 RepID=A0A3B1CKI0_9ZZZZ